MSNQNILDFIINEYDEICDKLYWLWYEWYYDNDTSKLYNEYCEIFGFDNAQRFDYFDNVISKRHEWLYNTISVFFTDTEIIDNIYYMITIYHG